MIRMYYYVYTLKHYEWWHLLWIDATLPQCNFLDKSSSMDTITDILSKCRKAKSSLRHTSIYNVYLKIQNPSSRWNKTILAPMVWKPYNIKTMLAPKTLRGGETRQFWLQWCENLTTRQFWLAPSHFHLNLIAPRCISRMVTSLRRHLGNIYWWLHWWLTQSEKKKTCIR